MSDTNSTIRFISDIAPAIACIASFALHDSFGEDERSKENVRAGRQPGSRTKKRKRTDMIEYLTEMDDLLFRRRYRMSRESFFRLLGIIGGRLPDTGKERQRGAVPNGPISKEARLSMALRVFSGGDKLDIASVHGVHPEEVRKSQWFVVDAIHTSPELDIGKGVVRKHSTTTQNNKQQSKLEDENIMTRITSMTVNPFQRTKTDHYQAQLTRA